VTVAGSDGKIPPQTQIRRWRDEAIEIVGLFSEDKTNSDVTLTLPQAVYAYDLRSRKDLGKTNRVAITLLPNRATFLAFCPDEVPEVKLTPDAAAVQMPGGALNAMLGIFSGPTPVVKRGTPLPFALSLPGAAGAHAFKVSAWLNGQELPRSAQVIVVGKEGARVIIPIAFDDPTGPCEVRATELFSNQTTTATVNVD